MRKFTVFYVLLILMIFKVNAQETPTKKAGASLESQDISHWDNSWDRYPTYNEYVAKLHYFDTHYPSICKLQSIGKTPLGRDIWVLKISDNAHLDEAEPEFLYSSTMHGDELTGFPLMIRLIDYLLSNYGNNAEVTQLVSTTEIYINPLANPDGTYRDFDNNTPIKKPIRANSNGVDLNRNYPDNLAGLHSDNSQYQPETKAFMAFEASRDFVLSANFHAGTEVVNYPNDNTTTKHADHDFYEHIAKEYALNAQRNSPKDYYKDALGRTFDFTEYPDYMAVEYDDCSNPSSPGVTQGAIWYPVNGSRQDYVNFYRHSKEITIELSFEKFIDQNELPQLWNFNKQAFLDLIKQANYGFQGVVADTSGNPIVAKISIANHDTANSYVYSNDDHGDYYRLIKSGNYAVTYEAPGYVTQTINIAVTDYSQTVKNVTMIAITPQPLANDVKVQFNDSVTLVASGKGTLHWYKNTTNKFPLYKGETFDAPEVLTSATYFVEDNINIPNVGSNNFCVQGEFLDGKTADQYLEFNCSTSVFLKSVIINCQNTGELEVQLQDHFGDVLDSRIIMVNSEGIQDINLDFIIPVGKNLRLVCSEMSSNLKLYSHFSAEDTHYPYTNDFVTITGNHANNLDEYYIFYDWKFKAFKSAMKEITVRMNNDVTALRSELETLKLSSTNFLNDID